MVGVKYRRDNPQIEAPGVVYHDDLGKTHRASPSVLKFVPFSTVSRELRPAGPLHVPTTIGDFSLDGRTAIFVTRGSGSRCDRIGMWSIPWHFSITLMSEPPFCPRHGGPGGITSLALGGQYFEAVTTYGHVQTLISSTIVRCVERVIARTSIAAGSASFRSIAADGPTMAYAFGPKASAGRVGFLSGLAQQGATSSDSPPVQVSVFRDNVAAANDRRLQPSGRKPPPQLADPARCGAHDRRPLRRRRLHDRSASVCATAVERSDRTPC